MALWGIGMDEHTKDGIEPVTFDRRFLLKGAFAVPFAALPLIGPLTGLLVTPALAQEAAALTTRVSLTTDAGREVSGVLALPANQAEGDTWPSVLLVHEWWGLDDQIKTMARALADEGYVVLAVDLYNGVVATDAATARYQSKNVKADEAIDTLTSWGNWLRAHEASTDKLGTCGWSFGGGWSLGASLNMTVDATVIYYGDVARSADELRNLQGPVMGHFGSRDMFINKDVVAGFESELTKAGRIATVHWYDADRGFANPAVSRYDEENTKIAWGRTLAFFKEYLS